MAYPFNQNHASMVDDNPQFNTEWNPDLDPNDLRELQDAEQDPTKIISELPKEAARMGYYSTICLIFNRMIGVGIFSSASAVFLNTQSIGLSLILWMLGAIVTLAGCFVFVELGLSIPRWPLGRTGEKVSAIRSGDGLNYFNYMLKRPVFLATCMYGITFIVLENTASNSVSFATNILDAAHITEAPGKIIAIAIAANTLCCLLHALSRKWGILLNNFLGTVKLFILLFVIVIGLIWINHDVAKENFDLKTSFNFDNSPRLPYRYAEAFIYVILPYGSFHQINYVVAEVREPRKIFPRASFAGVITVVVIYMAVNILYAAIIPKKLLFVAGGADVMGLFMTRTLGRVWTNPKHLATFVSVLKAISALGNIIVVTFTAARVKQEIAKEGILPYSLLFSGSYSLSLSGLFKRKTNSTPKNVYHEKTPVATLALHWVITSIFVIIPVLALQPVPYSTTAAYSYITIAWTYNIDVAYFVFISFGLLCLRFTPSVRWSEKSQLNRPWVSKISALVFFIGAVFPFIFMWVPDPKFPFATRTNNKVQWWAGQLLAACLLAFSFLYWVMFRLYLHIRSARGGMTLHVKREPIFKHDRSGLTQVFEIVTLQWKRAVGMRIDQIEETDNKYEESTRDSASPPPPDDTSGRGRISPYDGWESHTSSGLGQSSLHDIEVQQPRHTTRRKPVMSEMVA